MYVYVYKPNELNPFYKRLCVTNDRSRHKFGDKEGIVLKTMDQNEVREENPDTTEEALEDAMGENVDIEDDIPIRRSTPRTEPRMTLDQDIINQIAIAMSAALRVNPQSAALPDAPTFSGDKNDVDFDCFMESFTNVAELNGWHDDMKLRILRAKLRGGAATFVMTLTQTTKENYTLLLNALKKRYIPKEKTDLYQMEFSERRQKKNETLNELAESLKRLVRRAYPTMKDQTALDNLARNRFVEAIADNELRNDVRVWRK